MCLQDLNIAFYCALLLTYDSSSIAFLPQGNLSRRILPPLGRIVLPLKRKRIKEGRYYFYRRPSRQRNKNRVGISFIYVAFTYSISSAFRQLSYLIYWRLASEQSGFFSIGLLAIVAYIFRRRGDTVSLSCISKYRIYLYTPWRPY